MTGTDTSRPVEAVTVKVQLPGDVSASARYWKEDIIEPEVTVSKQGEIAIADSPGRGYSVKTDLVEQLTVRKESIRAYVTA